MNNEYKNFIREDLAHARSQALNSHKQTLLFEIETLKGKLQPHDTGHIHTAINVLEERCKEIDAQIYSTD